MWCIYDILCGYYLHPVKCTSTESLQDTLTLLVTSIPYLLTSTHHLSNCTHHQIGLAELYVVHTDRTVSGMSIY